MFNRRTAEPRRLDEMLRKAFDHRPQAAFFLGAPGNGKSAVVREVSRRDTRKDDLVHWGRLHERDSAGDRQIRLDPIRIWHCFPGVGKQNRVAAVRAAKSEELL